LYGGSTPLDLGEIQCPIGIVKSEDIPSSQKVERRGPIYSETNHSTEKTVIRAGWRVLALAAQYVHDNDDTYPLNPNDTEEHQRRLLTYHFTMVPSTIDPNARYRDD